MWPFGAKRTPPAPPADVPDELLGHVQRGVIAALGSLQQQINTLAEKVKLVDENATAARTMETRLARVDTLALSTRNLVEQELERVDQAVNQVRGLASGGTRGGKRSHATEIGSALLELLGPERADQLIAELSNRNGQQELPIGNENVFA